VHRHVLLSAGLKVALLVEEEPPQGAFLRVQVEHPVIDAASDHHVLRPTEPQLLSCVTNGAKGKEIVESAGLILQRLYILVEEAGKGGWVGL
jgi:hypothetical protein